MEDMDTFGGTELEYSPETCMIQAPRLRKVTGQTLWLLLEVCVSATLQAGLGLQSLSSTLQVPLPWDTPCAGKASNDWQWVEDRGSFLEVLALGRQEG